MPQEKDRYEGKDPIERIIQAKIDQNFSINPFTRVRGQYEEAVAGMEIQFALLAIGAAVAVPVFCLYLAWEAVKFVGVETGAAIVYTYNAAADALVAPPSAVVPCPNKAQMVKGTWGKAVYETVFPVECDIARVKVNCENSSEPPSFESAVTSYGVTYYVTAPNRHCKMTVTPRKAEAPTVH